MIEDQSQIKVLKIEADVKDIQIKELKDANEQAIAELSEERNKVINLTSENKRLKDSMKVLIEGSSDQIEEKLKALIDENQNLTL